MVLKSPGGILLPGLKIPWWDFEAGYKNPIEGELLYKIKIPRKDFIA